MGTTARGISYPDPAGVPSRSALQTLAQTADAAIGAAVTDTGWQTMTLSLGVGTARYRAVTLGSAVLVCVELSVSGLRGDLCTARERDALIERAQTAESALRIRDAQRDEVIAVMPKVAEVLEKFHVAGEQVRRERNEAGEPS
jgi:hypothetical protein